MRVLAVFLALLVFVTLYSVAIIASLNYLFHLDIGYTAGAVLAVACLSSVFTVRLKANAGA